MSRTIEQGMVLSERMEIRVIGTVAQLERASVISVPRMTFTIRASCILAKVRPSSTVNITKLPRKRVNPMGKTIKQIADELGVSKQAVTKCIDNLC